MQRSLLLDMHLILFGLQLVSRTTLQVTLFMQPLLPPEELLKLLKEVHCRLEDSH